MFIHATLHMFSDINLVAAAAKPPPDLPPQLQHVYLETSRRHRVDAVRRCIHGADLQRVLIFMNYQQTLQVMHMLLMCKGGRAMRTHICVWNLGVHQLSMGVAGVVL